ncbi:hypothetical protein LQZ21_01200 [Treponema sp. TIM-1]|uniref:PilZN3 domain-containing protein n=1 Tax=Treponema sp. TIM-1 TaxID=2898417 RepID=UPI00397F2B43
MANSLTGPAHYLEKFGDQSVVCNKFALNKLGVAQGQCFLKIGEYVILCVPFQFGFKRSLFFASLSKQELLFFKRYVNEIIGLSITFTRAGRGEPLKFFIRCNLTTIGHMKGRENVGLFVVDFKNTPNDFVVIMGEFLENQERMKAQYEDYGKTAIRITPLTAKMLGYNLYAAVVEPNAEVRRIQISSLSTKTIEHLEAAGSSYRFPGTSVAYQLFFKKHRIIISGTIVSVVTLPQGIIKTVSTLAFSPELVEIINDYWYNFHSSPALEKVR